MSPVNGWGMLLLASLLLGATKPVPAGAVYGAFSDGTWILCSKRFHATFSQYSERGPSGQLRPSPPLTSNMLLMYLVKLIKK